VSSNQDACQTAQPHTDQLEAAAIAIEQGSIIAVKGIGGYHIMCDATSEATVEKIRQRKPRAHKPLAIMFPSPVHAPFSDIDQHVELANSDREFLLQPSRPLLLARRKRSSSLAGNIAPGLDEVGVMLPYSPLHHLLLNRLNRPLVATSANISGEPVMIDNAMVEQRLSHIVDACLHHNRAIARPADDPVYRKIGQRPRPLRLGRGTAPLELTLPFTLSQPVLAVGAHMKNTIALGWRNRVVVSPHIGEMDSRRSLEAFEQSVNDLQQLYQVKAEMILRDAHPGYTTHRWARDYADAHHLPVCDVYHHHAHASAVYAEHCQTDNGNEISDMLVFTWDGTGYGVDGTLWGGEVLLGKAGQWRRVASLKPFELPGGDRVAREPWRTAAALCWQNGMQWQPETVADNEYRLLEQAWRKKLNTTRSSAMGRLFDAASALTGVCEHASFEGQGPMWLEALCSDTDVCLNPIEFNLDESGDVITADGSALLSMLLDGRLTKVARADCFHDSVAMLMLNTAQRLKSMHDFSCIGCSGGVFQNRTLYHRAQRLLTDAGFNIFLPELIPVNDAGISYGQIIDYGSTH
jgi:hydrogenase maturation protein HypF